MSVKTVTLIILRADRELWDGDAVRLRVTDMREGLKVLKNEPLAAGSHTILINLDLHFDAGQVYSISVDTKGHRTAWQLINRATFLREEGGTTIEVKGTTMRLMLVPNNPSSSNLNDAYALLRQEGSPAVADKTGLNKADYLKLDDPAKMALLNIDAKLRATRINGVAVLSFVEGLVLVDVDRLFLFVRPELRQFVDDSGDFASAPGHPKPPKGTPVQLPGHPKSWKHRKFGAGNLQLSFSEKTLALPGDNGKQVFSVDADIDLERGLLHVAEWLDNKFIHPSQKTNQTLVYALLFSQGILPHYTLNPDLG
ncbi:MAG: hypothetical protein ABI967_05370 [bacterium]